MTTATKSHDSLTCNLGPDGQPCAMCWWVNTRRGLIQCFHCFEWTAAQGPHVCKSQAEPSLLTEEEAQLVIGAIPLQALPNEPCDYESDNLTPPPNFESAWATAPREYRAYVEENHALYWYLCGMQDEQGITRLARRTLAREDVEEMGRLAQVRREG